MTDTAGPSAPSGTSAVSTTLPAPRIDFVGGNPTPTEIAAVTAVLAGVLEEISGHVEADAAQPQSAWTRAQRPIRTPMYPGAGVWRGFSG